MKERKTKVGKILQSITKNIPDLAGDVLGVVTSQNPVGSAINALVSKVTGKDSGLAQALQGVSNEDWDEYKLKERDQDLEEMRIEVRDRIDARNREVKLAQSGKKDYMHSVVGITGLSAFLLVIWVAMFETITNENLFFFIAGNVFAIATQIYSYYFGSSKGSKDKADQLDSFKKAF